MSGLPPGYSHGMGLGGVGGYPPGMQGVSPQHQGAMQQQVQPQNTFSQPSPIPRGSPSHPSQLTRSSPSHPPISRSPSHHSSPSHSLHHSSPSAVSLPSPSHGYSHPPAPALHPSLPSMSPAQSSSTGEQEEHARLRFQVELEFVQSLANPNYLHFLAQRGFMKEPTFINYLSYLLYWKEPQYVVFLKYPVCLHFLELLQHETFRKEIVSGQCARFIDDQVILHWQHYTRRRAKLFEAATTGGQQAASATPSQAKT